MKVRRIKRRRPLRSWSMRCLRIVARDIAALPMWLEVTTVDSPTRVELNPLTGERRFKPFE